MDAVKAVVQAYMDALSRSDVEAMVRTFAKDGVLMGHEMETVVGQDAIRRTLEGIFKNLSFRRELRFEHVEELGDHAIVRSHTTGTVTVLATKNVMSVHSRELFTLRKGSDGWRITNYMFNRIAPSPH